MVYKGFRDLGVETIQISFLCYEKLFLPISSKSVKKLLFSMSVNMSNTSFGIGRKGATSAVIYPSTMKVSDA